MSPVTGLARKAGRILSSVHMRNLIPVTEMKNVLKAQNTRGPAFRHLFRRLQHKYKNILNREIGRLTLYKNNFPDLSATLQAMLG